jgi:hypothetical protein
MITIDTFLKDNEIVFKTQKSKLNWFRGLKSLSLIRIGQTYFIDQIEMEILLSRDIEKRKIALRKRRNAAKAKAKVVSKEKKRGWMGSSEKDTTKDSN